MATSTLALVAEVERILATPGATPQSGALDAAETILRQRQGLVGTALDPSLEPLLEQQLLNLQTARELLRIIEAGPPDDLAKATALAKAATRHQALTLGLDPDAPAPPTPRHDLPSQAALALATRHGIDPTPEVLAETEKLDTHPEPVRSALAGVIDAFIAFEEATRQAYANADIERLLALAEETRGWMEQDDGDPEMPPAEIRAPGVFLAEAGLDLAPVLTARNGLLDVTLALRNALQQRGISQVQACSAVAVAPAFSIDLASCDSTYTQDLALLIDGGGNDVYHNNAGGGGADVLFCPSEPTLEAVQVAVLLDLDRGYDQYGNPEGPRGCGTNGGGFLGGAGFLLDEGGNDTYIAHGKGTNGGGLWGMGFLLDAGGSDTYTADEPSSAFDEGTNGGGAVGLGFLLDNEGNDTYIAGRGGVNGGGDAGSGFLLDLEGDDIYTAERHGANGGGGGSYSGVGFLLDAEGDDVYTAGNEGTNGGGHQVGIGTLLDAGGNDIYTAGYYGTNGGVSESGAGMLLDMRGNDEYAVGTRGGSNGGVVECPHQPCIFGLPSYPGTGLLLDTRGSDTYRVGSGRSWDRTVVPKGTVGAQVDVEAPIILSFKSRNNGDGTCTAYDDQNGNGVRDPGEQEYATLPCPTPQVHEEPSGTCMLYDDTNGNGARDAGEQDYATYPCPKPRAPTVFTNSTDHAYLHLGVAGAAATLQAPGGATLQIAYKNPPGCPPPAGSSAGDAVRACVVPAVLRVNFLGVVEGAWHADDRSQALDPSLFEVACSREGCLSGVGADGTWTIKPGTNDLGFPGGALLSVQGNVFDDVAQDSAPVESTGSGRWSRDQGMHVRFWNWHMQTPGSTHKTCGAGGLGPLVCYTSSSPQESVLELRRLSE